MPPVIRARDLSISYGPHTGDATRRVLSGVNAELELGETLGVVGSAGSGKSALGRILSARGLGRERVHPWPWISGGDLWIDEVDLRHATRAQARKLALTVGYLPADAGQQLRRDLTVAETIVDPVRSRDRSFSPQALGRAAAELIDAVDLELGVLNRYPHELSRGQRQRVAVARALIVEPRVLILDEPVAGVDLLARPVLFDLLERIVHSRKLATVVISNDLAVVERLTQKVLVLDSGVVIARGSIDHILDTPFNDYLRRMKHARDLATASTGGVSAERAAVSARVAAGLFRDLDDEDARIGDAAENAELDREALVAARPEFARFLPEAAQDAGAQDAGEQAEDSAAEDASAAALVITAGHDTAPEHPALDLATSPEHPAPNTTTEETA